MPPTKKTQNGDEDHSHPQFVILYFSYPFLCFSLYFVFSLYFCIRFGRHNGVKRECRESRQQSRCCKPNNTGITDKSHCAATMLHGKAKSPRGESEDLPNQHVTDPRGKGSELMTQKHLLILSALVCLLHPFGMAQDTLRRPITLPQVTVIQTNSRPETIKAQTPTQVATS